MIRLTLIVLLVELSLLGTTAHAWDCVGHMLTAMVAFSRSTAEVRTQLQPMLDFAKHRYFDQSVDAEYACWPDDIRSYTYVYGSWHYSDVCYNPTGYPCPAEPAGYMWRALNESYAKISDGSLDPSSRTFWLAWMLHLVGDAHQPMHVCTLFSDKFPHGDLGGNKFKFKYDGEWYKLHTFCDDALLLRAGGHVPRPVLSNATYWDHMQQLAEDLQNEYPITDAEAHDLTRATWEAEGASACRNYCYLNGNLHNGSEVNSTYINNLRNVLSRRIVLGGARLATFLGDAMERARRSAAGPAPQDSGSAKAAAIAISVIIAVVIAGLCVAAFIKRGHSRRRHVELVEDMPYERTAR